MTNAKLTKKALKAYRKANSAFDKSQAYFNEWLKGKGADRLNMYRAESEKWRVNAARARALSNMASAAQFFAA